MADIVVDGKVRVSYVPTIANIAAPTVAELNAGTLLQSLLIPSGGLTGFEPTQAEVDNTSLASTFDTRLPGRLSFSGTTLTFKKQDGTDTVFNLFVADLAGFIVLRMNGILESAAWAASQLVRVYPGRAGVAYPTGVGEANTVEKFVVPWPISATPNLRAVTA